MKVFQKWKLKVLVMEGLKHPYSQVQGDWDLRKILKPAPLPKKKVTRKKKVVVFKVKKEDEKNEKG
jgi:hypothetical protein